VQDAGCTRAIETLAPRQTASQKTAISPAQQTICKQQKPKEKKERKDMDPMPSATAKKCKERNDSR
jgi:hypothetical protein